MNRREIIQRAGMVLGYAISAPAIAAVMKGCRAKPDPGFKPLILSAAQAALVGEVAEIIIPRTDTPGAKDVGVPGFIDQVINDCYTKEEQQRFIAGLEEFDKGAAEDFGDTFISLDQARRVEHVKRVLGKALGEQWAAGDEPFILVVKELTLVGFFTSEPGATRVLQYAPVPGAYRGCQPLTEVGKTWAT